MHEFDYDAMQKKRIARGASHMKRGSKSKKCTLPSDYLTAAQKRRLNGPVSTYKLDEPMNWESFKAMPEDLQKKYILNLQETYQTTDEMLGMMFGKSKPGEIKEPEKVEEPYDEIDKFVSLDDTEEPEQIGIEVPEMTTDALIDILIPDRVSASFVVDAGDIDKAFERFKLVTIPTGKVRIRFEVEAV